MLNKKDKNILIRSGDTLFYQYDPVLGFWGIPNIERDVYFKGLNNNSVHVRHNNEGNRDKQVMKVQKGAVLCFGGSHTWGAGISQECRYTEYLEKITGSPVINLGHCSLGLDQICLAILNKAEYYQPSLIIVEQYPWAIHRVLNTYVNGYTRPYFFLDENGNLKFQKMLILSRLKIFRMIIGDYYSYRKELKEFKAGINIKDMYNPWTDPIFLYWKMHYYDYMYKLVEQILYVIQDFCRQKDIQLLFGLEPVMQQFNNKSSSTLIDYELPMKRLMTIFEKNRISAINMTAAMMAEHTIDDPVIFDDGHMNEKGHRIFAQELAKTIKERQLIDL